MKKNKKSFLLIPFGIQGILFIIMLLFYELFGNIIPLCIIFSILLFGINFWLFKNKNILSKKYKVEQNRVYSYFYWTFLISFIVLFGFTLLLDKAGFIVGIVFAAILICVIYCFFGTEIGCALRATGNNPNMVRAMGSNTKIYIVLGLVVGNGLVAMAGGLLAQYQGYADINMGVGTIVIGLAAIMIGEVLFSKRTYIHRLTGVVIGSIVYRIIIAFVLRISLTSNLIVKITADDMKLITAIIVVIALVAPSLKDNAAAKTLKGGH